MKVLLLIPSITVMMSLLPQFVRIQAFCSRRSYAASAYRYRNVLNLSENDQKFLDNGERVVRQTNDSMSIAGKEKCRRCWFYKSMCICGKLSDLSLGASPITTDIALFMHFKEYGKTTNTGKLVQLIAGEERCKTYVYGTSKADVGLLNIVRDESIQPVILYPTVDSVPISEFRKRDSQKKLVLCIIDSTWSQSKAMNRWFPNSVPRVHIDDFVSEKSLFLSRKQSIISSRVSTLEAIEKALLSLGEPASAVAPLIPALKLSVDVSRHSSLKTHQIIPLSTSCYFIIQNAGRISVEREKICIRK